MKLYRGEDEGELTKLLESPLGKAERRPIEPSVNQTNPEIPPEPAVEIQIVPENPEEIAVREGMKERIQAEIHHEDKEVEARVEKMLEVPPEWNEVPKLMMEDKDILPEAERFHQTEVAQVQRKQWKEDYIWPKKPGPRGRM